MDADKLYDGFKIYSRHISHLACHGAIDSISPEMIAEIRDLAKASLLLRGKPTGSVDSEQSASRLLGVVWKCIRELKRKESVKPQA